MFLADAAIVTVGSRTLAFSRESRVPPLDQVSELKLPLAEIDDGALSPRAAAERLAAIRVLPAHWSRPWRVLGLTLFSVGFGISVQATWQEVGVSALTGFLVNVLTPGSHGVRGLESWIGGYKIQGVTGLATMIGLLTAIAVGMLLAAAVLRPPRESFSA